MDSSGIVICRDADVPPDETVCNAASVTSAVAALVPFVAVTNPCKTPGAVAPVSAISGMVLRFVPLGTFSTTVALYGTLFEFTASITMSNVPVGSGLHHNAVDAHFVGLLDGHQHFPGNRSFRQRIHHQPADSGIIRTDLSRRERWLQAVCSIPFQHDGGACVEVDIQIHALPRHDLNRPTQNLSRRNFQSGVVLAA